LVIYPYLYKKGNMTHTCSNCKQDQPFIKVGSWRNVKTKLNKGENYHCRVCAGKLGRANSAKKPTGRPKGSKTRPERLQGHSRPGSGKRLSDSLSHEQRIQGIAKRNGYETYQDYRESLPEWRAYKLDVWRVTRQQPLHLLENFEKRGVNGEDGAYTLDHIVSLKKGFKEGIPAEQIGHIENLQMLPWEENITKGWK
jgi:hypothetical protein